ncbi:hypothetical protein MYXE_10160 [Mycobacterium xenopi]|uniref:PBP domain-containing protein n=1 Tax=Mycobacterium xenopi TaxID=1789 RepID=A0AAD1GYT4_MYCXE|nr:hypothetical protein MYXE_10160 [Mycobacterium xenopi]
MAQRHRLPDRATPRRLTPPSKPCPPRHPRPDPRNPKESWYRPADHPRPTAPHSAASQNNRVDGNTKSPIHGFRLSTLALDGPTAAKIFNGAITTWDDPAIKALNANATLPAEPIHVVFRSDQSGTTANFQEYLDAASNGAWGKGSGKTFNGGVGEGAKGNDGTSAAVKRTEGAITYNEWSFAQAQKLNMAKIVTSASPEPVAISTDSVGKTISGATIKGQGNDLVLDTMSFYKPTQAGAYPIVLATYEIVCSKYPESDVGTAVKAFLQATIGPGQTGLADNGYIPIPDGFKPRLSTAINAIS